MSDIKVKYNVTAPGYRHDRLYYPPGTDDPDAREFFTDVLGLYATWFEPEGGYEANGYTQVGERWLLIAVDPAADLLTDPVDGQEQGDGDDGQGQGDEITL